jgi:hypothetical protein
VKTHNKRREIANPEGEHHVMVEAETAVMHLQTKACQEPPAGTISWRDASKMLLLEPS